MRLPRLVLSLVLVLASAAQPACADDAVDKVRKKKRAATAKSIAFFESRIRPVLVKHCYSCHSTDSETAEGGLRVDSRNTIRAGGKRGPAVVPGNPKASWLLKAVSHSGSRLKMPPKQKRLPDAVIADLTAWIKMGAPDPREGTLAKRPGIPKADRTHWAYQPPRNPATPTVGGKAWGKSDVDHFILAKLAMNRMAPSPDAEPQVLLRRLHFDVVGLPPSPAAIERFRRRIVAEDWDVALAAEVDELLASPRFGEKWGRHWLDVARFGESSGGEANISFPHAWRYRDYVIDCVNADLPFNRFLVEQIAGDLLPYKDQTERVRLLVATGFLAVGPKNLDEANPRQFRADLVDEQIDAVTRSVMATSMACARCHDHKFDPFSTQDYYALAGIFASTRTYFGTAVSPANRVAGDPLPLPRVDGLKIFHRSISVKRVVALKAELAAMQKEKDVGMAAVRQAIAQGKDPAGIFSLRDALRIFWRSGAIEGQLEKVDESGHALPLAMGALDRDTVGDSPLLKRGDVAHPAKLVPRRFPEVIKIDGSFAIAGGQSGRMQLARWLTHRDHPLTSRVIVNRVWSHLFGAGLVRTVDNFGATGERPSHPGLLDHLAVRFMRNGWSIKQLVREIVLCRTYRQASTFDRKAFQNDPDNRLLWRGSKRRLMAESIRDAMLAVSDELDPSRPEASLVGRVIGDRPISLIGLDKRVPADLDGSVHRSVYLPVIRDRLPDALELFDFAEPSLVSGHRDTTNVPVQALYLMNSPFVQKQAAALASRLAREAMTNDGRVDAAFLLCFGRAPDAEERQRSLSFLNSRATGDAGGAAAGQRLLASFCQAMLCTAEFRNLD
jgi:cytochrome c553